MYMRYSDALKLFRRQAHVFAGAWKAVVLCGSGEQLELAFREAVDTMKGTSHAKGMVVNYAKRTIECANGADIRFAIANSMDDADLRLDGLTFTQMVLVGTQDLANYIAPQLRSTIVPPEEYKTCLVEGI